MRVGGGLVARGGELRMQIVDDDHEGEALLTSQMRQAGYRFQT